MKRYRIEFEGRKVGSLGLTHRVCRVVDAGSTEEAQMKAYETHEHIAGGAPGVLVTPLEPSLSELNFALTEMDAAGLKGCLAWPGAATRSGFVEVAFDDAVGTLERLRYAIQEESYDLNSARRFVLVREGVRVVISEALIRRRSGHQVRTWGRIEPR